MASGTTQWESGQSEKSMQSLKEQPYTGGCTKRLEMLLSNCSSATQVVQAVRFFKNVHCMYFIKRSWEKTKQPSTKPAEPKQREVQAVHHKLPSLHRAALHF